MKRDLIDAYFDGDLTKAQEAELAAWLRADRRNVERFVEAMHLHGALAEEVEEWMMTTPASTRAQARPARKKRALPVLLIAASVLIVVGMLAVYFYKQQAPNWSAVIADSHGAVRSSSPDKTLRANDTVSVDDAASVTVLYKDGSRLTLHQNTQLRLADTRNKTVILETGAIRVDASPQPRALPLLVETLHGHATVLGTSFRVRTDSNRTQLSVFEGKVRFDGANGHSLVLQAGQFLNASTTALETPVGAPSLIGAFELFEIDRKKAVALPEGHVVLDVEDLKGKRITLKAVTIPETVDYVDFRLESDRRKKPRKVHEEVWPYFLFGNTTSAGEPGFGDVDEWRPRPGRYTITAIPTHKGRQGQALTVSITVVDRR